MAAAAPVDDMVGSHWIRQTSTPAGGGGVVDRQAAEKERTDGTASRLHTSGGQQ